MAGLSNNAIRVLSVLRTCTEPLTDAELAEYANVSRRKVIDLARELLQAGYFVLADSRGRWLGTRAEAEAYERALKQRAKRIFVRRRAVRAALARSAQDLFEAAHVRT